MPANVASGGAPNRRSAVRLDPIAVPKASDVLATELRERILRGEFPDHTALPPERELVVQTAMSRTTVREALRILEVQGFVRIKSGRNGGAFVQRPGGQSMAESVALVIRGRQIRLSSLLETREAIEPFCARLAAENRTDADLVVLSAANDAIADAGDDLDKFLQANVDWHVAVATASHNELLTGLMIALSRAIYTATANEGFVNEDVRATTLRAHRSVTRAIRDQDSDAAARRMSRHVHTYAKSVMEFEKRTDIPLDGDA